AAVDVLHVHLRDLLDGPRQVPAPALVLDRHELAEALNDAPLRSVHLEEAGQHPDGDERHRHEPTKRGTLGRAATIALAPAVPTAATAEEVFDLALPGFHARIEIGAVRTTAPGVVATTGLIPSH